MKNEIVIDLELLNKQQDEINRLEGQIDADVLAGLNELIDTIKDMAEDYKQEKKISFVMVIE